MSDNFFVTAIVVSHDGATWLAETIAAISSQSRPVNRIIAVDNGSIDASAKMLSQSGITVLQGDREAGFGDAIDLALAHSKPITGDDQEELLWLLHDDIAPTRTALKFLIEGLEDKPQVAMVGPKLRGWYDRNHLLELGISIAVNGARWTGLEDGEQDQGQYEEQQEVLAVSTAAMLVRRKVFEDLGGLDPNLALFRDDVDLGWRARVAGYSVLTAPKALAFHAEASGTERRNVDVEEAFLHRPRLLDRRNAAYVLLVNVSWWLIPWVSLQLVGTAAIRAIGYLIAKLPGYAADEVAAVGILIIKPREILSARQKRKAKRLLSSRIVREYIPPRGSQIRQAWERTSQSISKWLKPNNIDEDLNEPMGYADIGVIDESFDDQELATVPRSSKWQTLRNRPLLAGLGLTTLVTLIASRNRFGALAGGALPIAHAGASDLFTKYSESWHVVGMGSAAPTPPWLALVGLASGVTLGNVGAFISLLFLITPPLAFFAMYRALKRLDLSVSLSVIGGIIYSMSPTIWASINEGRLGTIVISLVAPAFLGISKPTANLASRSWRKVYQTALFAGFIAAFSSAFLTIWTVLSITLISIELIQRRDEIRRLKPITFLMTADRERLKRLLAFAVLPGLLNAPWSLSLIFHPTQILQDPGLPLAGVALNRILLLNPSGVTGVPLWILSPAILFLFAVLFSGRFKLESLTAVGIFVIIIIISNLGTYGHGSSGNVWVGTLIIFLEIILIGPALKIFIELIPNLANSALGFGHVLTGLITAISIFSVGATTCWAITTGANSLVRQGQAEVVPAFIQSLSDTPGKPKTLVIGKSGSQLIYFVSRGSDLELGDPDVAVATPPELESAVEDLISGVGINSSKVIGAFGISYLFIKNPADQAVVRTIDGIGGFTRSSATTAGVVWRVVGSKSRVSITDASGTVTAVNANSIGAQDDISTPGNVVLAEKYDSGWKDLLNGKKLDLKKSPVGLPFFQAPQAGTLNIVHDGTKRRALLSIEFITLLTVIVLSLPAGRRRREVPIEELA